MALIAFFAHINMFVPALLVSLALYIKIRKPCPAPYTFLRTSLLYLVILLITDLVLRYKLASFFIPFCMVPILTTVLFSNIELGFILTLASSLSVAFIFNNIYVGALFLISGLCASMLIYGARRRMEILRVGLIIGIIQSLLLFISTGSENPKPVLYIIMLANGIISSVIALGVLPVFEYLFGTVTNISLLELADFNHPLLQKMILNAPGTYHHSLIVGNLSDAACQAVGANALLARIGAYYHDIGKIEKSEYFSENQDVEQSKHENLSPTISKLVIMNHVKDGEELAHKYKLNPRIIGFITQHHGNSLVYYFYRRALENLEEDQDIKEEGFRYPGPKPNTKETAVVLLADSVEAATRTLKDPTPGKIEELVHKVINNKFIDGQLDECELTLKDLEKISSVFIRILGGIYHSRIAYPEKSPTSANNHKKTAKENPRQSDKDKKATA